MKTFLPTLFAILILISSCISHGDKNSQRFTLQGEITGQDTGIIVLTYFSDPVLIRDTAEVNNGKFLFTGKIFETTRATLRDGNASELAVVYFEPQKMKISIFKDEITKFEMTGSKTQKESDLLNKMEKPFYERLSMLRDQRNKINDSIKNSKNDSTRLLLEIKAQDIDKTWSHIVKNIDSTQIKYVLENPRSFLAVIYLRSLGSREALSLDSLKSIFSGLDNLLKESSYGKNIIDIIRKKENVRIGAQAPDFKATDFNQQTITLTHFRGNNVVLLDFWASWCVPCLESLPHLKTIYEKYHHKGLEIISVSTDENRNAWIEAVKKNSMDIWYHILVAEKWPIGPITNDDIFQNYYNTAIPEVILIDKKGIIIYRLVGYSKESEEPLDKLLSGLFNE